MKPSNWIEALNICQEHALSYVLITVIEHSGSAPRNTGTKMVITEHDIFDTIGGGNLEFQVMRNAREMLNGKESVVTQETYPLAAKLGQCCGGSVTVLFEANIKQYQHIAIFGAGHVAQKLVPILNQLPVKIHWFDEREDFLSCSSDESIETIFTDSASQEVNHLPQNSLVLVMTHNHSLDFDIVQAALKRSDIQFVGMIGSKTKANRFRYRLRQRELSELEVKKLISPVGNLNVPGKAPIEVAVSIAAQVIAWQHEQVDVTQAYMEKESSC